MRIFALVVVAVFSGAGNLVAGNLNPPGPPGPTMKTLVAVEPRRPVHTLGGSATALYVIDQPGSYYFAHNIFGVNAKNGIEITVDNVKIDMMGFSLVGVPGSLNGIVINSSPTLIGLTIRSGFVRDWGDSGFDLRWVEGLLMEGVVVSGCGGWGSYSGRGVVKDSQFINNYGGIFLIDGSLIRCYATGNTTLGFEVLGGVVREVVSTYNGVGLGQGLGGSAVIEDSTFSDNDQGGMSVCYGNIIRNNNFYNNGNGTAGGAAIELRCGANLAEGNVVVGNDIGIEAYSGGGEVVIRNFLKGNTTTVLPRTGNDVAPLQKAATSTNPWANISN